MNECMKREPHRISSMQELRERERESGREGESKVIELGYVGMMMMM